MAGTQFLFALLFSSLVLIPQSLPSLRAQGADFSRTGLPEKSERVVSYKMTVRLDVKKKTLFGKQEIRYRNRTKGATDELRFHLYLNAFRNQFSTHLREAGPKARERYKSKEEYGDIHFTRLELMKGAGGPKDLLPSLRYDAPDDGNKDDRTVVVVPLPAAFAGGSEVLLETEFIAKLPKAYRRTGWGPGNFYMIAQWFPKLGVLEEGEAGNSTWNCHQFHANTEFFADFGSYEVTIETPTEFKVGATGKMQKKEELVGGYTARTFVQNDVHDFAWVADPDYVVIKETIDPEPLKETLEILEDEGYSDSELSLTPVEVTYFIQPEHDRPSIIDRHKKAVRIALSFFGSRFGRYPYDTLTVVDPGRDLDWSGLGGGMEYPTLITCGSPLFPHARRLSPEGVIIHEFGHQFWYGLSGNNEFEESWLDEGMTSYSEGRAQDLAYREIIPGINVGRPVWTTRFGPYTVKGAFPGSMGAPLGGIAKDKSILRGVLLDCWLSKGANAKLDAIGFMGNLLPDNVAELNYLRALPSVSFEKDIPQINLYSDRSRFLNSSGLDPVVRNAWEYLDRSSYRVNSYPRPATILNTIERMMGKKKWIPCLRRFHERARFTHPTTEDFIKTVAEWGGPEVEAFAREAFYTSKDLDYGISVLQNKGIAADGIFDPSEDQDRKRFVSTVVTVSRFGQIVVPVKLRFVFLKDGQESVEERIWEAAKQRPWKRFVFTATDLEKKGELIRAYVDPPDENAELNVGPAGVYVLDKNFLNNAWQKEPDHRPAIRRSLRSLIWSQAVSNFFGVIG